MAHGGYLRRRGHHRHLRRKAGGLPAHDGGLPQRTHRPDPRQINLPLRAEHKGLSGGGAGAEGAGHQCPLRARGHRHRQCEQRAHHRHLCRLRPKGERIHLRQYALELSAQDGKRRVQHLPRPLGLPAGREKPCRPRGGGRDRAAYLPRIPLRQESAGDRGNPERRGYIGTDMEIQGCGLYPAK